jgi:hypothetical protein
MRSPKMSPEPLTGHRSIDLACTGIISKPGRYSPNSYGQPSDYA